MTLEDAFEYYRDLQEIQNLKYRYCWAIDTNDVEGFATLFTDDGDLTARKFGNEEPHIDRSGRDELREIVEIRKRKLNRRLGQHRVHNPVIELDGDDAEGQWYFTATNMSAEGIFEFEFGEYHETYRRTPEGWKIRRCHIEFMEVEPVLREER